MNLREAAQQALEALEDSGLKADLISAADALRAALEPVTDCHDKEGDKLAPPLDAPETNFGNMAQVVDSLSADQSKDALGMVASVREDRTVWATSQESRQVEPVAWAVITKGGKLYKAASTKESAERKAQQQIDKLGAEWECSVVPLYTAPPKREPLTDAEIEFCMKQAYATVRGRNLEHAFARAIERAHGIGGEE